VDEGAEERLAGADALEAGRLGETAGLEGGQVAVDRCGLPEIGLVGR